MRPMTVFGDLPPGFGTQPNDRTEVTLPDAAMMFGTDLAHLNLR